MVIWFCEDVESQEQSGFGKTRKDAERFVSGNRGYDDYDGSGFSKCYKDGWCSKAKKISIPDAAAMILLKGCVI